MCMSIGESTMYQVSFIGFGNQLHLVNTPSLLCALAFRAALRWNTGRVWDMRTKGQPKLVP